MMQEIIPWDEWVSLIEPFYPQGERGRPPREFLLMLKLYLLQCWFALSDEGTEDAIYDSDSFRAFTDIDFYGKEQVPDSTTLCKFRKLLHDNKLTEKIFTAATQFLDQRGKIMHGGSIADATIVGAPASTKNAEEQRDPKMHQVPYILIIPLFDK